MTSSPNLAVSIHHPDYHAAPKLMFLLLMSSCSSQNTSSERETGSEAKLLEQLKLKALSADYTVSRGSEKDKPYENLRWRWYDVWVKEDGAWKLVSMQGTPLN